VIFLRAKAYGESESGCEMKKRGRRRGRGGKERRRRSPHAYPR